MNRLVTSLLLLALALALPGTLAAADPLVVSSQLLLSLPFISAASFVLSHGSGSSGAALAPPGRTSKCRWAPVE